MPRTTASISPSGPGGGTHAHVEDARRPRRDDAHHDGARVGRAAAGHVHGGGGDGNLAQPQPLALRELERGVLACGRVRDLGDVGDRDLQAGDELQRHLPDGVVELLGLHQQGRGLAPAGVEARGQLAERGVATLAHGGDDLGDLAGNRLAGRDQRADASGGADRPAEPGHVGLAEAQQLHLRAGSVRQRPHPPAQLVDLRRLQLVAHRVRDQPCAALEDLLAHDQVVLAQRGPRRRQIDDRLDDAGQGRQLDRALHLDDLGLPARLLEVAGGDPRVLGRDAHHAEAAQCLRRRVGAGLAREDHRAAAVAEIRQLVHAAAAVGVGAPAGELQQDVLAGDPEVRRAGLHVRRHVRGAHRDHADVVEQQLAVVRAQLGGVHAERCEQVDGLVEQRAARDGHGESAEGAHRAGSPSDALMAL